MNNNILPVTVIGHVKITDDLGDTLLDKKNAVHPQNMARVIARALASEDNHAIHRIAFGNGGTAVTGVGEITYYTPNDGITDNAGYQSRLYNETYYEVIDENGVLVSTGPGANPADDPASIPNVSGSGPGVFSEETGVISKVIITAVLNPGEPSGQFSNDNQAPIEDSESDFTFDEIGLFTSGAPLAPTSGYQNVNVAGKTNLSPTGLIDGIAYYFDITVDGTPITVTLAPLVLNGGTGSGGAYIYDDIIPLINAQLLGLAVCEITTPGVVQTYGMLRFTSTSTGASSTVAILDETIGSPGPTSSWLFGQLLDFVEIVPPVAGVNIGVQNAPTAPSTEADRMLTHIIFSPVLKSANRTLTINYTLTIQVAQSV